MKHLLLCAAALGFISFLSGPTFAVSYTATPPESEETSEVKESEGVKEESEEPLTFQEKLTEFNAGKAVFVESREILAGKLYDSEGKSIGEIKDVFIGEGGEIYGVLGVFGRLSLSGDVYLNKEDINLEGYEKGYKIGLSSDDIKQTFSDYTRKGPQPQDGKIISSKEFSDVRLVTMQGDEFGEIKTILYAENKMHIDAALVKVDFGPVRGQIVAVPFEAIGFEINKGRIKYLIDSKMAAKVMDFAITQKK